MENIQNGSSRPRTKNLFKNSCSRLLRIVSAVVVMITTEQVRSIDQNLFFFQRNLLIFKRWWQLWMKSTTTKQRYRMNLFFVESRLFVLLPNSMGKYGFTIDVHVSLLWTFRLVYEYEIEHEYDLSILVFRLHIISNTYPFQPMSYSPIRKPTWRTRALETSLVWNSKIVLVLNLVLVVQSEGP